VTSEIIQESHIANSSAVDLLLKKKKEPRLFEMLNSELKSLLAFP
jgi:hypothetical protein